VDSYRRPFDPDAQHELKRTANEARQRMEEELGTLAAIERELDRLDRQLAGLRAQLARDARDQRQRQH
jgi:hypothetical protein